VEAATMIPRVAWIATVFAQLSFFAVGGANSIIPEMQRHFVDTPGALDGTMFASLVALAQAAPGPNAMVVGLVGFHLAGLAGAAAATMGFCGPPAVLTLALGRVWGRLRATGVGGIVIEGVGPLTVGLVLASGWSLVNAEGVHVLTLAITGVAALGALWKGTAGLWFLAMGAVVAVVMG
jgi:chromate transporter